MPEQKIGLKSAKRFGTRYGASNKLRLSILEEEQRKFQPCPNCGKVKAAWKAVGIWHCRKCDTKFTAKAYSVTRAITFSKDKTENLTPTQIVENDKVADAKRKEAHDEEA